jgi:hypothetical protein
MTPKEVRKLWIKALKSKSKYIQGKGSLRSIDDRYCCLGVLCDLAVQNAIIPKPVIFGGCYYYLSFGTALPEIVREWAGLRSKVGISSTGHNLATLNDGLRSGTKSIKSKSFIEIAKILETDNSYFLEEKESKV